MIFKPDRSENENEAIFQEDENSSKGRFLLLQNFSIDDVNHWYSVPMVNIGQKVYRSNHQKQPNNCKLTFPYTSQKRLFGQTAETHISPLKIVKLFLKADSCRQAIPHPLILSTTAKNNG